MYPITDSALRWLEKILADRFGGVWRLSYINNSIHLTNETQHDAIIFDSLNSNFSLARSDMNCSQWDAKKEGWISALNTPIPSPGCKQLQLPLIETINNSLIIHYDILGLVYWMLARVEEIGRTDLDNHQRFTAKSSHAFKYQYLNRPIVDEWLFILRQAIRRLWPNIPLKENHGDHIVSCDVDSPYAYLAGGKKVARKLLGDLVVRKSLKVFTGNIKGLYKACKGDFSTDPHGLGVRWIMDVNEEFGNRVTFNFIPNRTHKKMDNNIPITSKYLDNMLGEISSRGHCIGVHPGYNSYNNQKEINAAIREVKEVISRYNPQQCRIGSRQHYLRWETGVTDILLNNQKLDYDSTLGYSDLPGFRCGTCFEYIFFDAKIQKELDFREQPLIYMDASVLHKKNMGLGYSPEAIEIAKDLKNKCELVGGSFSILWHNSRFRSQQDVIFFRELISC